MSRSAPLTDQLRVWLNGKIYDDPRQAFIPALDHGTVVGDGVFEALKVSGQGPFTVRRHLDRLTRSARAMGLPDPDHDIIRAAIDSLLEGRDYADGMIRITYTGGAGPLGSQAAFGPPTLMVASDSRTLSEPSVAVVTTPWTRNESGAMTGVKTTSYAENVRGLAFAAEQGASEGIFVNNAGHVCEGTGSNIFYVFGSEIITPPLASGPLAGITRDLVLQWCDVKEADLSLAEAQTADEVFLTSSLRDVQAVHQWDSVEFEVIGPLTKAVIATFAGGSTEQLDP